MERISCEALPIVYALQICTFVRKGGGGNGCINKVNVSGTNPVFESCSRPTINEQIMQY